MSFFNTEFTSLSQLSVFLVHFIDGLFVTNDVQIVAPSRTVFSVKSEIMNSVYLQWCKPCSLNAKKKIYIYTVTQNTTTTNSTTHNNNNYYNYYNNHSNDNAINNKVNKQHTLDDFPSAPSSFQWNCTHN